MHDGRKELPEMWKTVLALLLFDDVPPFPLTGFIAETTDTHDKYFHAFNRVGYSVELIKKWDYLDEIAPGYCIAQKAPPIEETNAKENMFSEAESEMYFCAFRYCLGRQTYIVSDFCSEAALKITRIDINDLVLMEKELSEAIRKDDNDRAKGKEVKTLGWDCDREEWIKFSKILSAEIQRRKNYNT